MKAHAWAALGGSAVGGRGEGCGGSRDGLTVPKKPIAPDAPLQERPWTLALDETEQVPVEHGTLLTIPDDHAQMMKSTEIEGGPAPLRHRALRACSRR